MTRDLDLGPVANPDGSPTDLTRAMLAGTGRDPVAFAASSRKRTMRVRVTLSVLIDLDDYRLNYGTDDAATIRADVKHAVRDAVVTGAVFHDGIVDADLID